MRSLLYALVLVGLAVAGYFGARHWQSVPGAQLLNDGASCNLGDAACRHATPDGGMLLLDISPRPVPLMQAVGVSVRATDTSLVPAYVEITGLNMEMGVNRVPLRRDADGTWVGETIIPVCSQRHMQWQAALFLKDEGGLYRLNDEFDTLRP
jgi:hypothetical protein